ncbi:hypothetical protein AN644_04275 [Candidatus Epulonipiscium fishelsonii]|nr:hypothetical protein AN644_04275 [Epulopiscium sp. SCG-C06WGA-EpuloA1]
MLSAQLQLALQYQGQNLLSSFINTTGISNPDIWEVVVYYIGSLDNIEENFKVVIEVINKNYCVMTISKYEIRRLSEQPNILYIELPEVMKYILDKAVSDICGAKLGDPQRSFGVTGKGTLVAFIDSGIDYTHPDFINADGTTRINYIWDQTLSGNPPDGFKRGIEYTKDQINEALKQVEKGKNLEIVPSIDTLGHGTAVAGIACGNGRLNKKYKGVAPESELIIVKIGKNGMQNSTYEPRNVEVMLALKYITNKAKELNKPVSILIGLGINEGSHDGTSTLEIYIDEVSREWQTNVVVGTGNQANKDSHTSGVIETDETQEVEIFIEKNQPYYFLTLWKSFIDDFAIVVDSPVGQKTEILTRKVNNRSFILGDTLVMINFSTGAPEERGEQILIFFDAMDENINSGIWKLEIIGIEVIEGRYDIWSEALDGAQRTARFLNPTNEMTLTMPSTGKNITSVGASNNFQIASFSGQGYTRDGRIKPDITSPGVNIMTPSIDKLRYSNVSGTSAAAAFIVGAYSLLMEYLIVQNRDRFLYGERLKLYLLRNTRSYIQNGPYPNRQWGYGELCIKDTLQELSEIYDN